MNNQYLRFTDMLQSTVEQELHKFDVVATCRQMEYNEYTDTFTVNGHPYILEQDAFTQMVKIINPSNSQRNNAVSVADYLWNNKGNGIFGYAVERHLTEHPNQQFLVRTYDNTIRGMLSPNYAVMNNSTVLMRVAGVINDNNILNDDFRVVESFIGRDSVRIKLLFSDYNDGEYGTGIYFSNDELGNGSVAFHSLVKRAICDNSLISADNMSLYHRGAIESRMATLEPELVASVNYSASLLQSLQNSRRKGYTIEQYNDAVVKIQERYNFSDEFVERMHQGSEGEVNLFGIVNGITYAAKEMKDREHYEKIAAKIMEKYG